MNWLWVEEPIPYTGAELRSHWLRERFGLRGDAAAAFVGPCGVRKEHVIDMDERISGEPIAAQSMLHMICEHFQVSLREMVVRQRLLSAICLETMREKGSELAQMLTRRGDDLFLGRRKLSVGIATVSPVSALCHFGVNVTEAGVPVPAAALDELGLAPGIFGPLVLERYAAEMDGVVDAVAKVRPAP